MAKELRTQAEQEQGAGEVLTVAEQEQAAAAKAAGAEQVPVARVRVGSRGRWRRQLTSVRSKGRRRLASAGAGRRWKQQGREVGLGFGSLGVKIQGLWLWVLHTCTNLIER